MTKIYLDYAATTPVHPEVVEAMFPYFTNVFGNPSSIHTPGQEAKEALEESRAKVADLIGARTEEIVFTSGGTEADNLAILGVAYASEDRGNHIVTTSIEHHAVLETCKFLGSRGFAVTYIPVDEHGLVAPDDIRKAITSKTILISVMHANNEIGTIEPISEIGNIAREAVIYFHTDAVQAVGHIPVNVDELGVSLLSMSAHKLYGPKGVGALYVRKGTELAPHMHGGSQEGELRASTHNIPGIVGFGCAAAIAQQDIDKEMEWLTYLRNKLINGLREKIDHIRLNGHPLKRLPNNVNISIGFVEGHAMVLSLDHEGICAGSGSACISSSKEPSYVLLALGQPPEQAHNSLRLTLGKLTTEEEIDTVLEILPQVVDRLRAKQPSF